jgi:hypothetical protein
MDVDITTERAVLNWLANGSTDGGILDCSETMAFWLCFDVVKKDSPYPRDPEDFASCLQLLRVAPALRPRLHKMSALSTAWARLVAHWTLLEDTFLAEDGWHWQVVDGTSTTYALLEAITEGRYRPSPAK